MTKRGKPYDLAALKREDGEYDNMWIEEMLSDMIRDTRGGAAWLLHRVTEATRKAQLPGLGERVY